MKLMPNVSRTNPPSPVRRGLTCNASVIACALAGSQRGPMLVNLGFWLLLMPLAAGSAVQPVLEAFPLSSVRLTPGSQEALAADLNAEYLRMIDIEDMLWTFRQNAGMQPVPGSQPFWGVRASGRCAFGVADAARSQSINAENQRALLMFAAELGGSICGGPGAVHRPLPERNRTLVQSHR